MADSNRLSRLSTLLGAWGTYWLLLAGVKLGPAIVAIFRATRGSGGSVNLSYGDQGFLLDVLRQGETVYRATSSFLSIALWVGVPPLLMWVVWIALRNARARSETAASLRR